jgi:Transposase DNA-binding
MNFEAATLVRLCMKAESWELSREEFGHAEVGDTRRNARVVAMGAAAFESPSGKVAAVFGIEREREAAYDFLENDLVDAEDIMASVAKATALRARGLPFVFVPVDGSSISVADRARKRDFGNVGNDSHGARGLKLVDALAVDPDGTVIGWLALTFWARAAKREILGTHARKTRPLEQKETRFWVQTIRAAQAVLDEHKLRGWFQIDREGDGRDMLLALEGTGHWWTVRGNQDRSIELEGESKDQLRSQMSSRPVAGHYTLDVTARPGRKARTARMVVRSAEVVLRLREPRTKRITKLAVNVVWAREEGTTPAKEAPIDWLLFTNRPIATFDDAKLVLDGYAQRWRVEECHRTWKSGECDVESTQLESFDAVRRWATILAPVATRTERLKRLARKETTRDLPATVELGPLEIRALKLLKFGRDDDARVPTVAEAVAWLAELGGFTNKYSGKPPGSIVLGRGLRKLRPAAQILAIQTRCERSVHS